MGLLVVTPLCDSAHWLSSVQDVETFQGLAELRGNTSVTAGHVCGRDRQADGFHA